jgi:hypothetical protein
MTFWACCKEHGNRPNWSPKTAEHFMPLQTLGCCSTSSFDQLRVTEKDTGYRTERDPNSRSPTSFRPESRVEASWQQGQQESLARHVFRVFNS